MSMRARSVLPLASVLCALVVLAFAADVRAGGPPARAIENADCFGCHGDRDLSKTTADGAKVPLFVEEAQFAASIHGHNRCTSCHGDITQLPHPDGFHAKPVACSECHRVESGIYLASDHGQAVHRGVAEAASCKDCHGATHSLLDSRNPASPVYRTNLPKTCARCHGNVREMAKFHLRQENPIGSYETSVHGLALLQKQALNAAVCTDCHGSHDLHRSTNPASKLYWQTVPKTCGKCHENVERTYMRSIHGKAMAQGVRDAPVCTDCHGEHSIVAVKLPASRVSPANVPETCAQCHAAKRIVTQYQLPPDVFSTYIQSFHGLALQGGNPTVANCSSCHGTHDILPSSDPLSTVNAKGLPQTCGKCHPGIGTRLGAEFFKVHAPPGRDADKPWIVNLVADVYIALIVLTIGGMALFVALDYLRKARDHVRAVKADPSAELRLTPSLKWQHLVLTVLFVTLAYTGFVHKFPDAFFAWPFKALSNGNAVRAFVHRLAGWAFVGFFIVHLGALVFTASGRSHGRAIWFAWRDIGDAFGQLLFNLGLRRDPPPHRRWNYAEKAEYWALVWGSVVMIVTGAMLVFTEAMLRLLPKVWHDVAQVVHFYEAVLATLAIVVWHAYWAVFDPAEYPMNTAWITGTRRSHHAPAAPDTPAAPVEPPDAGTA
jgi:cytochrome b subunit of formate dehydrogenase